MKKKILALICALAVSLVSNIGYGAERLLPDLKKQDGLTTVYVGKTLIRLTGCNVLNVASGVVDVDDIVNYLDGIEIVSADNRKSVEYLRYRLDEALKKIKGLDIAMEMNEDDQEVKIYTAPGSSQEKISRILIVVNEKDELTVIDMQGDIPVDALENM